MGRLDRLTDDYNIYNTLITKSEGSSRDGREKKLGEVLPGRIDKKGVHHEVT